MENQQNQNEAANGRSDSTAGLDSRHWWMGGTFVTNIGADRMPVMREAVRRFGDSNIVLLEESQPPAPKDYGGCLHNLKPGDLSDFWQVVRDVDEESNAM